MYQMTMWKEFEKGVAISDEPTENDHLKLQQLPQKDVIVVLFLLPQVARCKDFRWLISCYSIYLKDIY